MFDLAIAKFVYHDLITDETYMCQLGQIESISISSNMQVITNIKGIIKHFVDEISIELGPRQNGTDVLFEMQRATREQSLIVRNKQHLAILGSLDTYWID